MNRQLREKVKNNFEKDFELFRFRKDHRKCKETPRYHALRKKERKKEKTKIRSNQQVSKPSYHTTKRFPENFLVVKMKKK